MAHATAPRAPQTPLEVTEWLFRQPRPFSAGMVVNRPAGGMSLAGRLFQARMWRRYAMDWDLPLDNLRRRWVESIGRVSRAECLRRARVNIYLARRINRHARMTDDARARLIAEARAVRDVHLEEGEVDVLDLITRLADALSTAEAELVRVRENKRAPYIQGACAALTWMNAGMPMEDIERAADDYVAGILAKGLGNG